MKRSHSSLGRWLLLISLISLVSLIFPSHRIVTAKELKGKKIRPEATPFATPKPTLLKGEIVPDFTLDSITGERYSLSSTRGKVVLLDFWHTY